MNLAERGKAEELFSELKRFFFFFSGADTMRNSFV
jgi:hypothetical protein